MISTPIANWLNWLWTDTADGFPVSEWSIRMAVIFTFVGLVVGVVAFVKSKELSFIPGFTTVGLAVGFFGTLALPAVVGWPLVALFWAVGL